MKFGTIARLAAIALGMMSIAIFIAWGGDLPISQIFENVLELFEGALGTFFRTVEKDVVRPAFDGLNGIGLQLELYPHWKHVFIFMWLPFVSIVRSISRYGNVAETIAVGGWGFLIALFTGAFSGTVPIDSQNIVNWGMAGLTLFFITRPGGARFGRFIPVALSLLTWLGFGLLFLPLIHLAPMIALGIVIMFLALGFVVVGFVQQGGDGETAFQKGINDDLTRAGTDILFTMLAAATLVYVSLLLA